MFSFLIIVKRHKSETSNVYAKTKLQVHFYEMIKHVLYFEPDDVSN